MPYAFISHLSDDNFRLGVYIDRLLEALDEKIELWIDNPAQIKPALSGHPRVKAIPPGTEWNKEIEAAVENAKCVLAFWSAKFPVKEDREVFIREIDRGRKYDCCIQIAIDRRQDCKIRAPFTDDQILEVINIVSNPQCKAHFDQVIERVRQLIEAPERSPQVLPVPEHLLPYLANRHPQMRPICRTVRKKQDASGARLAVGEPSVVRPSLFVVPCRNYDETHTFSKRLTAKDGPECSGFDAARDTPDWVRADRVLWPEKASLDRFGAAFRDDNEYQVRDALKQSKQRRRPVCFSTWVELADIDSQVCAFVGAWMRSWPDLLAQAMQNIMPYEVRNAPQPPIVALLFLRCERRGWLSRLLADDRTWVVERCNELQKLELDAVASSAVDFRVLDPLALVTHGDANLWLTLDEVMKSASYYQRATTAIDGLFGRPGLGVPMKTFANVLLKAGV
jgi:hypothetical protein